MKTLDQITPNAQRLAEGSTTSTTIFEETQTDPGDKVKTNQFFAVVKSIYLNKFDIQFPDSETLTRCKRQFSADIGELTSDEFNNGMKLTKNQKIKGNPDFNWPDISKIIGLCKSKQRLAPSHRYFEKVERLDSDEAKAKKRKIDEAGIEALKAALRD